MNTNEVSVINLDQLVSMSSYDFLTKVINPARVEAGEKPNDKEPTIKILRKGYDWLKDNWKDIAHDMRTSNTLKTGSADGCRIKDLKRLDVNLTSSLKDSKGRKLSHLAWLFDEPTVYKMLLRGHRRPHHNYLKSFCLHPVACWSPFTWGLE
ncbi:hypothetical protein V3601_003813 [Escherichia coli]